MTCPSVHCLEVVWPDYMELTLPPDISSDQVRLCRCLHLLLIAVTLLLFTITRLIEISMIARILCSLAR